MAEKKTIIRKKSQVIRVAAHSGKTQKGQSGGAGEEDKGGGSLDQEGAEEGEEKEEFVDEEGEEKVSGGDF